MHDWMNWTILAGVVVMLDLFSGTFYLLMVAIGLSAGALIAWLGGVLEQQLIVAALVGSVATVLLRRSQLGGRQKLSASCDPDVNPDIGQLINITDWHASAPGRHTARAMYRGAQWDVEFLGSGVVQPGMFKIVEVQGSQLIVQPCE